MWTRASRPHLRWIKKWKDAFVVNIGGGCARWAGTLEANLENKLYDVKLEKTSFVCFLKGVTCWLRRRHTKAKGGREMSRVKHSFCDGARA